MIVEAYASAASMPSNQICIGPMYTSVPWPNTERQPRSMAHRDRQRVSRPKCITVVRTAKEPIGESQTAHNGTYAALVLYLWVVSGGIELVAPCLLLGFRAV